MASGSLQAEEARQKHRWNENSKVYTRKFYKSKTAQNTLPAANTNTEKVATVTTAATTTDANDDKAATTGATTATVVDGNIAATGAATADDITTIYATTTTANEGLTVAQTIQLTIPIDNGNCDTATPNNDNAVVNFEDRPMNGDSALAEERIKETSPLAPRPASPGAQPADGPPLALPSASPGVQPAKDVPPLAPRLASPGVQPAKDAPLLAPPSASPGVQPAEDAPSLAPPSASPGVRPAEDAQYQHHQSDLLRTEAVVSEDSSTLNQHGATVTVAVANNDGNVVPNGSDSVSAAMTQVDDKVNISFSSVRTKKEAKDLKRKLVSDLEEVRSLWRKLVDKEARISFVNSAEPGAAGIGGGGQSRSQYSTNDGQGMGGSALRVDSEVGSAGMNESRPFRSLSVSLMNIGQVAVEKVEKEKRTPKANQFYKSSDFIYGKEKFPPAESNKKHKSSSKKHASGGGIGGFRFDKTLFKKCSSLLQRLMKHKHGWVFNDPVDVKGLGLHDYYDVIKHPMDLGTVKNRLNKNWYKSPLEFAEDVRLTFRNAMTYNPEGQDVHAMAVELSNIFEEKWAEIDAEYNRKLRFEMLHNMGYPTPRRAPVPSYVVPPVPYIPVPPLPSLQKPREYKRSESINLPVEPKPKPVVYQTPPARTPVPKKPKAKDPNKRDMTFEEKQRLSTNLQALPPEKHESILQIIKRRNSAVSQNNNEIEVDIDNVDPETLWELDRFVTNYKKSLSKHKRKAELALQAKAAAEQAVQQAQQLAPAPPSIEVPKDTRTDETNGAASSHLQEEKPTDNASGSSSSSSSSSDSGSSSSDSDSDSSSGSDTDEDR